jgi:hypothetical protein
MQINILIGSLLKNKKNIARSFNQWPLVAAFISGPRFCPYYSPTVHRVTEPVSDSYGKGLMAG